MAENPPSDADRRREAVLAAFLDCWNARDVDGLMALMAADCVFLASAGPDAAGTAHRGREAVRAAYAALFAGFPEASWTEGSHCVHGETGLSSWRFVGTDRDGKRVDVRGCDIFAFAGDLIAVKDSYRKARTG